MGVAHKLSGYLHRVFDKDPGAALAFRMRYDGSGMTWTVAGGRLTTSVTGGTGAALDIALASHTIGSLAVAVDAATGYSVPFVASDPAISGLSALALIESSGNQNASNGDHLTVYTSLLWPWLTAVGGELESAQTAIGEMVQQMTIPTADGEWLDEIGGYYGIRRQSAEPDAAYGPRIIAEILRPKCNNKAMALALTAALGMPCDVIDAGIIAESSTPRYGSFVYGDGTRYGSGAPSVLFPCQFDVSVDVSGYDGDLAELTQRALALIDSFRAAGTRLRRLYRAGSCGFYYDGRSRYDGARCYGNPLQDPLSLEYPPAPSGVGAWQIDFGPTPFTVT